VRVPLILTYSRALPDIGKILRSHQKIIKKSPQLRKIFKDQQIRLTLTPKPYGIDFLTVFGWSDRLWRYICLSVGFSYSFVFKNSLSKTIMVSKNSIWQQLLEQSSDKPHTYFRYVDDIWGIWLHGEKTLKKFHDLANSVFRIVLFLKTHYPKQLWCPNIQFGFKKI
jgi:hypothetical protein